MKIPVFAKAIALGLAAFVTAQPAQAEELVAECAPFEAVGSGPDLVLVPGLGASPQTWDGVVDRLSQDYRVHLVHIAGFAGRPSSGDPEGLLDRTVTEIIGQLDCYGVEKASYAGHSLGGFLGLKLSLEHPERVNRLVIVDALPFYPLIFSPAATVDMMKPQADGIRAQILAQDDATFLQFQQSGVRSLVKTQSRHEQVVGWSLASDRPTFAGAFHLLMTTDLRASLSEIETPATILAAVNAFAMRERVEPLYTAAYADLENAELRLIEDSYHFIMFDQPEAFEAELLRALNQRAAGEPDAL